MGRQAVASLERELGDGFEVRHPRMPDEDDPKYAKWKPAILREVDALDDGELVVGHSIGGTMLVNALAEEFSCGGSSPDFSPPSGWTPPSQGNKDLKLGAIALVGAPFVARAAGRGDEFHAARATSARKLPRAWAVHLHQGPSPTRPRRRPTPSFTPGRSRRPRCHRPPGAGPPAEQ